MGDAVKLQAERIKQWASQDRLEELLKSLHEFPRLFTAEGRPWEPKNSSSEEVLRAYKRATTFVHPDRLLGRAEEEISEAQEILKVLTMARTKHAETPRQHWAPRHTAPPTHSKPYSHLEPEDSDDFVAPPFVPRPQVDPGSPRASEATMDGQTKFPSDEEASTERMPSAENTPTVSPTASDHSTVDLEPEGFDLDGVGAASNGAIPPCSRPPAPADEAPSQPPTTPSPSPEMGSIRQPPIAGQPARVNQEAIDDDLSSDCETSRVTLLGEKTKSELIALVS